jgi:SNF2 family DNA or RNA helicase
MPALKSVAGNRLHQHQLTAVDWMIQREANMAYRGGFLCDEMGLGKTMTTASLLLNKPVAKTLILTPLAVVQQWVELLDKTGLAIMTFGKRGWTHIAGNVRRGSVYVANYDKLLTNPSFFGGEWQRLVLDEAHTMRNYDSKKYEQLVKVSAARKWFLTGTPSVNRPSDVSALMHLLNNNIIAESNNKTNAVEWMSNYALARTVQQVRTVLPNSLPTVSKIHKHRLDFKTEDEEDFYKKIQTDAQLELQHLLNLPQNGQVQMMILNVLLRLRQISTHPQVYIEAMRKQYGKSYTRPDWKDDSAKTEAICNILKTEQGCHGYVVFCHFSTEIAVLKKRLEKESSIQKVLVYDGSMTAEARTRVIAETKKLMSVSKNAQDIDQTLRLVWQNAPMLPKDVLKHVLAPLLGRHVVLLAQIQSAGTGINLQHMDRVIFTTPWWTAALMDQAVARVVRLGQKRKVEVHYLAHKAEEEFSQTINIDDYINARVEMKRELCEELLAAAAHDL